MGESWTLNNGLQVEGVKDYFRKNAAKKGEKKMSVQLHVHNQRPDKQWQYMEKIARSPSSVGYLNWHF